MTAYADVIAALEARKVELAATFDAEVAKVDRAIAAIRELEAPAATLAPQPTARPRRLKAATLAAPTTSAPRPRPAHNASDAHRIDRLRTLVAAGKTRLEIAAEFGVTGARIYQLMNQHGIRWPDEARAGKQQITAALPIDQPDAVEISNTSTLVDFLRGRDCEVKAVGAGKFKLGANEIDSAALLERANRERKLIGKPPFRFRGQG